MPKRNETMRVRLSWAEWCRVKAEAARNGRTVSSWLRSVLNDKFGGPAADNPSRPSCGTNDTRR